MYVCVCRAIRERDLLCVLDEVSQQQPHATLVQKLEVIRTVYGPHRCGMCNEHVLKLISKKET